MGKTATVVSRCDTCTGKDAIKSTGNWLVYSCKPPIEILTKVKGYVCPNHSQVVDSEDLI